MQPQDIEKILEKVKENKISVREALQQLKKLPFENLDFAKIDTHRHLRKGFPEVILCKGKTTQQIVEIVKKSNIFLATKASKEIYEAVKKVNNNAIYNEIAQTIVFKKNNATKKGKILVVSAGTADMPIAEEAAVTAEVMGNRVERVYDVGVAGIHRLFENKEKLFNASVIIVVAGMEGALASVVGGLVDKPVLAVPTSVGYGASFKGIAPMLTMLNCCSPGVAVVNIDNGFGAGYMASLINR